MYTFSSERIECYAEIQIIFGPVYKPRKTYLRKISRGGFIIYRKVKGYWRRFERMKYKYYYGKEIE